MAVLPIRIYPDPVLRERAAEVDVVDEAIRKLVRDMEDTMRDAPGVGLAAPQVGVQRRVIVFDASEESDELRVLVNPSLAEHHGEVLGEEGCLSIPGLAFDVVRAERVRVRGLDLDGQPVDFVSEDFEARVIQHEVDHLDGILFIDRLDEEARKAALRVIKERALADDGSAVAAAQPSRL